MTDHEREIRAIIDIAAEKVFGHGEAFTELNPGGFWWIVRHGERFELLAHISATETNRMGVDRFRKKAESIIRKSHKELVKERKAS